MNVNHDLCRKFKCLNLLEGNNIDYCKLSLIKEFSRKSSTQDFNDEVLVEECSYYLEYLLELQDV